MKKLYAIPFLLLLAACDAVKHKEEIVIPPSPVVYLDVTSVPNCTVLRVAKDTNRNGLWDLEDREQQQSMVCNGANGQDGTSCSVAPEMSGAIQIGSRISCTDGTFTLVLNGDKGEAGQNGNDGANGMDGQSCTAATVPSIPVIAPNGGVAISCPGQLLPRIIHNGAKGNKGDTGSTGSTGATGAGIGLETSSANPGQCLAGGVVLRFFRDMNNNGVRNSGDSIVDTTVICNGENGTSGTSSSVSTSNVSSGNHNCPYGGLSITTTTGSSSSTEYVCNGRPGQDGQDGQDGDDGVNGTNGLSAYQVAVANGYTGTELQWLESLVGPKGGNGADGMSAYEVWEAQPGNGGKTESEFLSSLVGPAGTDGQNGLSAYDLWLDLGNTGTESDFLSSLVGPAGSPGTNGSNGQSAYQIWLSLGNTGSEAQFLASLVGPAGTNGSNGTNGTNGANGLSAYQIWLGLGNVGTETDFINALRGSVGPQGPQGPQGPAGPMANITTTAGFVPYKLCPGDNSTFPEYGFIVGTDIYAVYYGVIGGQQQAFMAKLNDGTYTTTNGASCSFTIGHNPNGDLTINGTVVVVAQNMVTGLIVYDSELSRTAGVHNNADVKIRLKNVSNLTLNKFKVTIVGNTSGGVVRSGSSLNSPGGTLLSSTVNSVTFLVTNYGAIPPGSFVDLTVLFDKLGTETLTYTVEAL